MVARRQQYDMDRSNKSGDCTYCGVRWYLPTYDEDVPNKKTDKQDQFNKRGIAHRPGIQLVGFYTVADGNIVFLLLFSI